MLMGQGSVDLTADIATTTSPAIQTASRLLPSGETESGSALTITSRGALSLTASNANFYPGSAVSLSENDAFANAGTITVLERRASVFGQIGAISGGKSVTNDGTITLDGAIGIQNARKLTNTGRIVQAAGSLAATGISGTEMIVNSGTIKVAGPAVLLNYSYSGRPTLENSGRIASTSGSAILQTSSSAIIRNLAGGSIVGGAGAVAIRASGAELTNAGTITGDVDLGYASYGTDNRSFQSATYTAAGGTLNGSLRFGEGDDVFVAVDG